MNEIAAFTPDCLFYTWPRQENVTCTVVTAGTTENGANWVTLSGSPLFPESGGQPCDNGSINNIPVTSIVEDGNRIVVYTAAPLTKGETVQVTVDTKRSYDFAAHHTAQHLLSAVILSLFGAPTVSMHLGEDVCTIDVQTPSFTREQALQAEERCASLIFENRPVRIHWCPPENVADFPLRKTPPQSDLIRVVDIGSFDYSPCCAPHVPSTALLGQIVITAFEKYKGMMRISFVAANRAAAYGAEIRTQTADIAALLKTNVTTLSAAVTTVLSKLHKTEQDLAALKDVVARSTAQSLYDKNHDASVITFTDCDADFDAVLQTARHLQKITTAIIAAASIPSLRSVVMTSNSATDVKTLTEPFLTKCNAKGGGNRSMIQASFCNKSDLEQFMTAINNQGENE